MKQLSELFEGVENKANSVKDPFSRTPRSTPDLRPCDYNDGDSLFCTIEETKEEPTRSTTSIEEGREAYLRMPVIKEDALA